MSTTIDQKVVRMEFDNKKFESNVETSISTLDKLKKSLDFDGAEKSFEKIEKAAEGVDLKGFSDSIVTVTEKFSVLEQVAIAAVRNITNGIMNTGKQLIKSVTVDQISTGFAKYEEKTGAVQTIIAATGQSIEDVNKQLEKLMWFTDETSYNFTDMVSSIGKFTSNGIELEPAVDAMQGIATWAALSGANATTASMAMNQLSQALAAGSVKLMDWRSIEGYNMSTEEFKKTVLETAAAMGTLKKQADGTYKTIKSKGKKSVTVTTTSFSKALDSGFFTSDVLMKSLERYGGFATLLKEAQDFAGIDVASKMLEYLTKFKEGTLDVDALAEELGVDTEGLTKRFKALADANMKLGDKAFRAAQEAKTWSEALGSVKEAVASGWMATFENIFGNYEEAKKLFTDIANGLYDVFAESGNLRNEILEEWKDLEKGGRDDLIATFWDLWDKVAAVVQPIKDVFREVFPRKSAQELGDIVTKVRLFVKYLGLSDAATERMKETFRGAFEALKSLLSSIKSLFISFKPVKSETDVLRKILSGIVTVINFLAARISSGIKMLSGFIGVIRAAAFGVLHFFSPVVDIVKELYDRIVGSGMLDKMADAVRKPLKRLELIIINLKTNLRVLRMQDLLFRLFRGIVDWITKIVDKTNELKDSKFGQWIGTVISKLKHFGKVAGEVFGVLFDKFSALFPGHDEYVNSMPYVINQMLQEPKGLSESAQKVLNVFDKIKDVFKRIWETLKMIGSAVKESSLGPAIKSIGESIKLLIVKIFDLSTAVSDAESGKKGLSKEQLIDFFNKIGDALSRFAVRLREFVDSLDGPRLAKITAIVLGVSALAYGLYQLKYGLEWIKDILMAKKFIAAFNGLFESAMDYLDAERLKALLKGYATAVLEIAAAMWIIAQIPEDRLFGALTVVSILLWEIRTIVKEVEKTNKDKGWDSKLKTDSLFGTFLGLALALMSMIHVIKVLSEMSPEELAKGFGGITTLMLLMVAFVYSVSSFKGGKSGAKGVTSMMRSLLVVILIMALITKNLGKVPPKQLAIGEAAILGFVVIMVAFLWLSKLASKGVGGSKAGAISALLGSFVGTIVVMALVVKFLGEIPPEKLVAGELAVLGMAGIIVGFIELSKLASKGMGGAKAGVISAILGSLVGALTVMTILVAVLGSIPTKSLIIGVIALAAIMGLLVGFIALTSKIKSPDASGLLKIATAIAMFGVALIAVGAGLFAIGLALPKLADGIVYFAVTIAAAGDVVHKVFLEVFDFIADILLRLMDTVLKIVLYAIDKLPVILEKLATAIYNSRDSIVKIIGSLVDILLDVFMENIPKYVSAVLTLIEAVLSELSNRIGPVLESLFNFLQNTFDTIAKRLPDLLGPLGDILFELVDTWLRALDTISLEDLGELAAKLGAIEGILVELGVVFGSALGLTELFDGDILGEKLADFVYGLEPFTEALSEIDPGILEGAKNLAEAVLEMTGADVLNSLTSWFTGNNDEFATKIASLGTGIRSFYDALLDENGKSIDADVVSSAANGAKALAALNQSLPRTGGKLQQWIGEPNMEKFGTGVAMVGVGLRMFYDSIMGVGDRAIDTTTVTSAANAAMALAKVNNYLPRTGGKLQQWIFGEKSLDTFASGIAKLGGGMATYASLISGVDPATIETSAKAAQMLVDLENALPTTGFWESHVTLEDFGKFLDSFGTSYRKFYGTVMAMKIDTVMKPAVQNLRELIGVSSLAGQLKPENVAFFDATLDYIAKGSIQHFMDAYSTANVKAKFEEAIDSFSDGITSATTAKEQTIIDASNAFVLTAITAIGNADAKMKMFIEGSNLGARVISGLEYRKEEVKSTCKTIGEEAYKALKAALEAGPEEFGPPVIRPVLDLTDIQNGVSNMYSMLSGASGLAYQSSYSVSNDFKKHNDTLLSATNAAIDRLNNEVALMKETPSMTVENTFNITGDDPKAIATEVSRILQKQVERREASWA